MFFGEFGYRIDEKGRVPIPPRFRPVLKKEGIVLTPGVERCVTIYPLSEWKKLAASLTSDIVQSKLRRLNRAIFATAFSTALDGQGRIVVPPPLRQYAEIEDEVVVAGTNNCLELWSKKQWEAEKARSQEEAWQIIESLERR